MPNLAIVVLKESALLSHTAAEMTAGRNVMMTLHNSVMAARDRSPGRPKAFPASRIAAIFPVLRTPRRIKERQGGMIGMMRVLKSIFAIGLLAILLSPASSHADEFRLSNNQRISCGRGLSAGKLNTATCRSYAYLFDIKTSEYYRCTVSLALTRNNKEVLNVQSDGSCEKKFRIFDTDSDYSFDATETEPPNTNSFFGQGGYAIWASDNNARKVRGCIIISSGLGSDISKCVDMKFK